MGSVFGGAKGSDSGAAYQKAEEERKAALRAQVGSLFDSDSAKSQFATEDKTLGDSLRSYYTDELGRKFADAKRNLTFRISDTGNLGSAYSDELGRLERENQLGATRIDEAVRQALAELSAQRENTRSNALNMIASGGGAEAVNAATAGLKNSISMANSQAKQQLFGDILSDAAVNKMAYDGGTKDQAMLAALKQRTSAFYNPLNGGSGTVVRY